MVSEATQQLKDMPLPSPMHDRFLAMCTQQNLLSTPVVTTFVLDVVQQILTSPTQPPASKQDLYNRINHGTQEPEDAPALAAVGRELGNGHYPQH